MSSPEVSDSRTFADVTVPPSPNQTIQSHDTVQVSQDVFVTSQEPLIFYPFLPLMMMLGVSSLGLSLGDVSGLEEIINKYKNKVNVYTL